MIRRIRETLLALALMPLVGLMRLFGLQFNLANIWGLPLIIGASAEFGLNVVLRYLEDRLHGGPLERTDHEEGVGYPAGRRAP